MPTDLDALRNAAAREMAKKTDLDYEYCKSAISVFLSDASEAQLLRFEVRGGAVESHKLKNILHTRGKIDVIDFAEAITTAAGGALAHSSVEVILHVIHAGLFVVKTFRKLTTIELSEIDAAIVLAMYRLGGKSLSLDAIQQGFKIVLPDGRVSNANLSRDDVIARLLQLKILGCVDDANGAWRLSEAVTQVA